jgi:hypothetical protein
MKKTIKTLLAEAGKLARLKQARAAWAVEIGNRLLAAQFAMDERLCAAVDQLSEEEFERLFEKEQAKIDAIRKPLNLAADKDLWPRELYSGGI